MWLSWSWRLEYESYWQTDLQSNFFFSLRSCLNLISCHFFFWLFQNLVIVLVMLDWLMYPFRVSCYGFQRSLSLLYPMFSNQIGGEFTFFFWSHKCSKMDVVRSISYIWCLGVRVLFVCFSCGHSNERITSFAYWLFWFYSFPS